MILLNRHRPLPIWAILLVSVGSMASLPAHAQENEAPESRRMVVDDLFGIEAVGSYLGQSAVFSPDGQLLAYVRVRPAAEARIHDAPYLAGNDRADVWVGTTDGRDPINVTRGARNGTGYWAPVWSPDGEYLAMYCTDGDDVFLCIWERGADDIRRLGGEGGIDIVPDGPVWVSTAELVNSVLPPGETPRSLAVLRQTPRVAMEAWPKVREGREPTASVLDSGTDVGLEEPAGRFMRFDVRTGEAVVIYDGDVFHPTVAPAGGHIAAFIRVGFVSPDSDRLLPHRSDHWIYELRIFDRTGLVPVDGLEGRHPMIRSAVYWAPDGRRVAFAAEARDETPGAVSIGVVDLASKAVRDVPIDGLHPHPSTILFRPRPSVRWGSRGELLVRAREAGEDRMDWWLLQDNGSRTNLTDALESPPSDLHLERGQPSWVGVADGEVWRVAVGREPVNLTGSLDKHVSAFAWPREEESEAEGIRWAVVRARSDEAESAETELFGLDLGSERLTPIAIPGAWDPPEAAPELVTASQPAERLVFHEADGDGTVLWLAGLRGEDPRPLFEANLFLRSIAEGEPRLIRYRGLEGDSLAAWILLPPGYDDSKRYPLVTWVYAGSVSNETRPPTLSRLNFAHTLNLQVLAARDYAVLFPSMPLTVQGKANDPYLELTRGVLPAVDRAIDLGIADPDRLAVIGQSYGGYSTYGLVTLTSRFDAAIALAGLSDLVSIYGTLTGRNRYETDAHRDFFRFTIAETGQTSMGNPPWKDMQRYLRNSPISYVHRVETPLLAIHGDLDYVPVEQAEQFFMSLVRQNKRARFVRYWGEGHVFSSPANIRHMWGQIFDWLAEFLPEAGGEAVANGGQ